MGVIFHLPEEQLRALEFRRAANEKGFIIDAYRGNKITTRAMCPTHVILRNASLAGVDGRVQVETGDMRSR